jgi:multiple sugar transport system permease protein
MASTSISAPGAVGKPRWWQRQSVREGVWLVLVHLFLIFVAMMLLLPFYWLVTSALKPEPDLFIYPPKWLPNPATLDNFRRAFTGEMYEEHGTSAVMFYFPRYVRNTLIIIVGNMAFGVTTSALVAYSLARLRFPGRDLLFYTVVGALFLPAVVLIIPRFVIFSKLSLTKTFWPLIVPGFFGYANQIFFLRQFFLTIPSELEDSAYVDGCSTFRFWWQIMLPLCKPAVAVQLIITFMYHWNDFLDPLIYLGVGGDLTTLQLAIVQVMDPRALRYGVLMAYSTILIVPCLLIFFLFQRTLIQGVVFTGVKG